ncbi:MAG: FAD-dependent oxidoreductase, partial [Chloroflexota bacterium]|nr:FAD-dependent oxidoreductase [Chloroflexota bacterium]
MTEQTLPHVVILGAGFAGIAVAQELARQFPEETQCRLTLVDQNNFSLFTPMLTEVVGGEVDAEAIVGAVRALAPRCRYEQGRVDHIDVAAKTVTLSIGGEDSAVPAAERTVRCDHLVIALGSVVNYRHISGLREHSLGAKSIDQALAIRNRALALLERADEESDASVRRKLLTFVVGGGGFSGVETMAALNDLVRASVPRYSGINPSDIHT